MTSLLDEVFTVLVFPGFIFSVVMAFWFEYLERKITARVQKRVGPLITGPRGLLQPFIDVVKLLCKEEIVPRGTDIFAFRIAPVLAVTIPVFGMCFIPIISWKTPLSFQADFLLVFLLLALSLLNVALTGYSVLSPYTSMGVGRLLVQYSMYEGIFLLSLISAMIQTQTISFEGLLRYQSMKGPLILYQPISFVCALLALLAKLEKRPFDLPHAKQEIVAGWETELSGRGLAFIRLYTDLSMVWGISLLVIVFLGGPLGPGFDSLMPVAGFTWFAIKALGLTILLTVISASTGRIRVYGLANIFWERLYPLLLVQLLISYFLRWL
uniref:NADH-quinone oxidoreductase subunit H n=1 Tax=Thermofilum adornatum TaxID=1365176 RepID=A0A7C1CET8_9CREN